MAVVGTSFREFYDAHQVAEVALKKAWFSEPEHRSTIAAARFRLQARPFFRAIQKGEARWLQRPASRKFLWPKWERWHARMRAMAHELGKIPNQKWGIEDSIIKNADDAIERAYDELKSGAGVGERGTGPLKWKRWVFGGVALGGLVYAVPFLIPLLAMKAPRPSRKK